MKEAHLPAGGSSSGHPLFQILEKVCKTEASNGLCKLISVHTANHSRDFVVVGIVLLGSRVTFQIPVAADDCTAYQLQENSETDPGLVLVKVVLHDSRKVTQ